MIHPRLFRIIIELNEKYSRDSYEELRREEQAKRRKQKQKEMRRAQEKQNASNKKTNR